MKKKFGKEHVSRILAIQTLYAYNIDNHKKSFKIFANDILTRFNNKELFDDFNMVQFKKYRDLDELFFNSIVDAYTNAKLAQREVITKHLKKDWTFDKLDLLLKCILILAVLELQYFGDISAKVILDEYVTITKSFYEKGEVGFANGILDAIAKEIRPHEFSDINSHS